MGVKKVSETVFFLLEKILFFTGIVIMIVSITGDAVGFLLGFCILNLGLYFRKVNKSGEGGNDGEEE